MTLFSHLLGGMMVEDIYYSTNTQSIEDRTAADDVGRLSNPVRSLSLHGLRVSFEPEQKHVFS